MRNKARISLLTMPIQHFTERPSQCNEIREGSKRYRYLEEKNEIIINNKKTPGINKPGVYVNKVNISEKAMAPHSSTLAWKIPWTEEPGGLQSMGSLRVGHN